MAITLTKEDGSIVTDANTYVDLIDFANYCEDSGYVITSYNTATQQAALLRSMRFIDNYFVWKGSTVSGVDVITDRQYLQWPRNDVIDDCGNEVNNTIIPDRIQKAVAEGAYQELIEISVLQPKKDREVASFEVVNLVAKKFKVSALRKNITAITDLVKPYTKSSSTLNRT